MAFIIKRNDLRPYLPFRFFEPDGVTGLDVSAATEINLVCRAVGAGVEAAPKFKKPVDMTNAAAGIGEYRWSADDTDTPGQFEYEFEITWPGGEPQTIPADSYFQLTVVDDVG